MTTPGFGLPPGDGELVRLATMHGSDKAAACLIYEPYLSSARDEEFFLLEIGVGGYDNPAIGGASLRTWRDYFPKAHKFGVDIHDKSAHEGDRIRTFRGSQDDPEFLRSVVAEMGRLDVVIDDGSHIRLSYNQIVRDSISAAFAGRIVHGGRSRYIILERLGRQRRFKRSGNLDELFQADLRWNKLSRVSPSVYTLLCRCKHQIYSFLLEHCNLAEGVRQFVGRRDFFGHLRTRSPGESRDPSVRRRSC